MERGQLINVVGLPPSKKSIYGLESSGSRDCEYFPEHCCHSQGTPSPVSKTVAAQDFHHLFLLNAQRRVSILPMERIRCPLRLEMLCSIESVNRDRYELIQARLKSVGCSDIQGIMSNSRE